MLAHFVFVGDLRKFMLMKIFPLHSINFEHFVNSMHVANDESVMLVVLTPKKTLNVCTTRIFVDTKRTKYNGSTNYHFLLSC